MPNKDPVIQRENHARYMREVWYPRNRKKHIKLVAAYKDKLDDLIRKMKNRPCADCGKQYPPWVMDFDHVRGRKRFQLSAASKRNGRNAIMEEVKKCDVVCSNCHRQRTYDRLIARGAMSK